MINFIQQFLPEKLTTDLAADIGNGELKRRVEKAYTEILSGYRENPNLQLDNVFNSDCPDESLILVDSIPFYSLCEHHLLPFFGMVRIGYIHKGQVFGLSKLSRLVLGYSRRLQMQERLTQQLAGALFANEAVLGVGVEIVARHLCMEMRGVMNPAKTRTHILHGVMKKDMYRHQFYHNQGGVNESNHY